jgi:hypothetical protein
MFAQGNEGRLVLNGWGRDAIARSRRLFEQQMRWTASAAPDAPAIPAPNGKSCGSANAPWLDYKEEGVVNAASQQHRYNVHLDGVHVAGI